MAGQVIIPVAPAIPIIPDINGIRYDYSSLEINLGPSGLVTGITGINYEYELMPGEARGTAAQLIGRGRGQYKAKGDITLFSWEAQNLITALANLAAGINKGFMEWPFDVKVDKGDAGQPVLTDFLRGCRITKGSNAFKNDQNLLVEKFDLSIPYLLKNGCAPFQPGGAGLQGFFQG